MEHIDAGEVPGGNLGDLNPGVPSPITEEAHEPKLKLADAPLNPEIASLSSDLDVDPSMRATEAETRGNGPPESAEVAGHDPEFAGSATRRPSDGIDLPDLAEASPSSSTVSDTSPQPATPAAAFGGSPTSIDLDLGQAAENPPSPSVADSLDTREANSTGPPPPQPNAANNPAPRGPSKYRPQLRERQADASQRSRQAVTAPKQFAGGSLEADLRLVFQPGDWGVELSILLSRPESSPDEVDVQLGLETLQLSALDDGLFEPVPLSGAETALSDGIAAESLEVPRRRWVRTGRQLHVFSERTGVYGFVSVPRVLIGLENVILCAASVADRVLAYCEAAGSTPPGEVHGPGVPENWRCFRGFRPQWPGEWIDDEIFLALSPLPHAAIEFTGGIALARMGWLAGRPPSIRILGGNPSPGAVTIDGNPAERDSADRWTASGWDAVGNHAVRYAGLSRRYEIADPEGEWPSWSAHSGRGVSVSGALAADAAGHPQVVLSGVATWVLGSRPGEVTWAPALPGGFAAACTPSFRPVWAVAAKVGRHRPVPRLLDSLEPPGSAIRAPRETVRLWCELIRGAAREKKATTHGESSALWQSYVETARLVRRRVR